MKKYFNLILKIILVVLIITSFGSVKSKAMAYVDYLNIELTDVYELGSTKLLKVSVYNAKYTSYSLGDVNPCTITLKTDKGTYTKEVREDIINYGENTFIFLIQANGQIESLKFDGIVPFDGNNQPVYTLSETLAPLEIGAYASLEGVNVVNLTNPVIFIAVIALAVVLIKLVKKRKALKRRAALKRGGTGSYCPTSRYKSSYSSSRHNSTPANSAHQNFVNQEAQRLFDEQNRFQEYINAEQNRQFQENFDRFNQESLQTHNDFVNQSNDLINQNNDFMNQNNFFNQF